MKKIPTPVESVATLLQGYADRAVFRGFSQGQTRGGKTTFKMLWHRDRFFELILDVPAKTMRFPVVLPELPADSSIYEDLKAFVQSQFSKELPDHRRIDPRKVRIRCSRRGGNASITLTLLGRDFEYAARKLIHLVHEIYMSFLNDGRYYEYMVATFDLDPDKF